MNLLSRLWNLIAFGSLGPVNDTGPVQTAQVSIGYMEVQDARPVIGVYGLASNAPAGADAVMLFQGGDRSKGIVIGINHQGSRPTGQAPGETSLYNDFDMRIYLAQGGIVIDGGGKPITVTNGDLHTGNIYATGTVGCTGTVAVTGEITVNGTIVTVP